MDWITLAGIIAQEGLAVGESIYNKWASGLLPTAADFDQLRALGKKTPEDLVLQAASLAGLDNGDPKVGQLLALVARPIDPGYQPSPPTGPGPSEPPPAPQP
jgi:hypothetical protein